MFTLCKRLAQAGFAGAALLSANLSPVSAADIYDRYGQGPSPYDDPRYADVYGYPSPPVADAPPPAYGARYERPYAYFDEAPAPRDPYGYLRPMRPRADIGCMPREDIRRSLMREGWGDFRNLEIEGNTATLHARRPSGQPYRLRVDRCTGDIVRAHPLDERPVPYAYRDRFAPRPY